MKRKECRACHCVQCRSGGKEKQIMYRWSNRKVRQQTNRQLKRLDDLGDFDQVLVGGIYTD